MRNQELATAGLTGFLTVALFSLLEWLRPGYFLWDDNSAYYLPFYVFNWQAVVEGGALPSLNFHQYLGHLYLGTGQPAVFYLPVYLGTFLAKALWGDFRYTVDVLAVLHLGAAAMAMFFVLRRFGVRRGLAVASGLLWVTFPFLAQVARNWIFISYVAALLPLNLLFLDRLYERPGAGRALALAAIKALLFFQGYIQFAIIIAGFDLVYLALRLLVSHRLSEESRPAAGRVGLAYLAAVAATGLLAAPLLFPMIQATLLSAYRNQTLSFAEFISNYLRMRTFLLAQLFVMRPQELFLSTSSIYYFGIGNLAALAAVLLSPLRKRREAAVFVVSACASLLGLVLASRAHGLLYGVPLLSSFRWPFKYFLIFLFFGSVAVAGGLELLWRSTRRGRRALVVAALVVGLAANVGILFAKRFDTPFGPCRVDRNVAEIRHEVASMLGPRPGRVVSLWLSPLEPRLYQLLIFDFATLAGVYHIGGYDPLVSKKNLQLAMKLEYSNIFRYELNRPTLDHLSSWGVRYLVVPQRENFPAIFARFPQLRLHYRGEGLEVYENTSAWPLALFAEDPKRTVVLDYGVDELRLTLPEDSAGPLMVNFAPLPGYVWSADGRNMGRAPFVNDRMLLEVPPGTRRVVVRYVDLPLTVGLMVSTAFVLSLASVASLRAVKRRRRGRASPNRVEC